MVGKRKEGAVRLGGGLLYYLGLLLAMPVLFPLVVLWFLADVGFQIATGKEGLSDDGIVPRIYKKTQGTGNWAAFGSDEKRWGRK